MCRLYGFHNTFRITVYKYCHPISQYISRMLLNHLITINGVFCKISSKFAYVILNWGDIATVDTSLAQFLFNEFQEDFRNGFESQSWFHPCMILWQSCLFMKIDNCILKFVKYTWESLLIRSLYSRSKCHNNRVQEVLCIIKLFAKFTEGVLIHLYVLANTCRIRSFSNFIWGTVASS